MKAPEQQRSGSRFTLRQLAYVVAASENRSTTEAALKLNVSQPSISGAIAKIEIEFDLQIFIRHHALGLSLTPEGERFIRAARSLLQQADELHTLADEMTGGISGPLSVGVFRSLSALLMPELCQSFMAQYPHVVFNILEGNEAELIAKLRNGQISIALTYAINLPPELEFEPLASLPTYILLSASHRFANAASLGLKDLSDDGFILLDLPLSRDYFMSIFEQAGLTPNIVARSESPETVRSYVATNFGFSLLTARPVNKTALNGKDLAYVRLEGDTPAMILGAATLRGVRRTNLVDGFVQHCRTSITTDQLPGMANIP